MEDLLETRNLKKYIRLYDEYQETNDADIQDEIQEKIENLWFDLNDDEIVYIETQNLNI